MTDNQIYPIPKYSAGVIAFREYAGRYEVLLVEHTAKSKIQSGLVGFPAGKIEVYEEVKMAAKREFEEESGATVDSIGLELLCVLNGMVNIEGKDRPTIYNVFLSNIHTEDLTPSDNGKTIPNWYQVKHVSFLDNISSDILILVNAGLERFKYNQKKGLYLKDNF